MKLEPGEEFTAKVDKINPNGTCTVKYDGKTINIGPVTCDIGRSVRLRYIDGDSVAGTSIHFALCLTDEVHEDGYDDHVRRHVSSLLPDRPPEEGEQTYIEIDKVDKYGLGIAVAGGDLVELGPVQAQAGDLVHVVGRESGFAELINVRARGKRYQTRFNILRERWEKLPVKEGETFTTTIDDTDGSSLIAYLDGVPIHFPKGSAQIAQKVDGKLTRFHRGRGIGEVTKVYDTIGNIDDPGHDTRMQNLQKAGIGSNPFRSFAQRFIGVSDEELPSNETEIRKAIIGEAIRLGLAEKAESGDQYPQAHITAIRHWVVHKLSAVLGDPISNDSESDGVGWFRSALTERSGPTITFLGDVIQLSQGYYAPAPTRVVMISESEAVLISGDPSREFLNSELDLEFRGLTRIITETSMEELKSKGIPLQPKEEYIGLGQAPMTSPATLREYIDQRPQESWEPEEDWAPYTGQYYGFRTDGKPLVIEEADGTIMSLWRVPVEYGADTYQLKVQADGETNGVTISPKYRKHVSLILDAMAEDPQTVELTAYDEGVLVSCDFAPPQAQMRWLYAVGAEWLDTSSYQLQWKITGADADSVQEVFDELPVTIIDNT
ncbi:hypothetical protein [Halobacterium salinarum]|uniref:hypothetical protein n=1 Tax=Halobacterium salinarum TaxID=2242 RepID=UPI00255442E5|nr:hypothetical protein [Halobacterium salinarum]MDL0127916.1 hypothetical protein [Halobacterium salinarum]